MLIKEPSEKREKLNAIMKELLEYLQENEIETELNAIFKVKKRNIGRYDWMF